MKKILIIAASLLAWPVFSSCTDYGVYGTNSGYNGGYVNAGYAPLQVGFIGTSYNRWAYDPYRRAYFDRSLNRYYNISTRRYYVSTPRRYSRAVYPRGYRKGSRINAPSYLPRGNSSNFARRTNVRQNNSNARRTNARQNNNNVRRTNNVNSKPSTRRNSNGFNSNSSIRRTPNNGSFRGSVRGTSPVRGASKVQGISRGRSPLTYQSRSGNARSGSNTPSTTYFNDRAHSVPNVVSTNNREGKVKQREERPQRDVQTVSRSTQSSTRRPSSRQTPQNVRNNQPRETKVREQSSRQSFSARGSGSSRSNSDSPRSSRGRSDYRRR